MSPFGAEEGKLKKDSSNNVQIAEKLNNKGDIIDMHSYGGKETVTEEVYEDAFANEALNGQTGTSITQDHNLITVNNDYSRANKTLISALATQS